MCVLCPFISTVSQRHHGLPAPLRVAVLSVLHRWPGNSSRFITNAQALLQAPFPLQCLQSTQETTSGLIPRTEQGRNVRLLPLLLNFQESKDQEDPVPTLWAETFLK